VQREDRHDSSDRLDLCSCIAIHVQVAGAAEAIKLRPPAVPLVTHDPYFSIWSQADRLTDLGTTHWTGRPHPLRSLLRVDGKVYRLMSGEPADVPALPQTGVVVFPTRTVYRFADSQVVVSLTFLTPALPSDLEVLARPVTYLVWEVRSADGRPHAVQLYFDDSAWKQGSAGFGTPQTPGAILRTLWNTKDIWLRREFTLGPEKLADPQLAAHCDEDGTVYINGVLAAELPGWTTRYEQFDLQPQAVAALHPGKNVLAVHCQQTTGGQYIDVGIVVPMPTDDKRQ
jgi:hypothetical protein